MKHLYFLLFTIVLVGLMSCAHEPTGLLIEGQVSGLNGDKIYFDKSPFNAPFESLANAELSNGQFTIKLAEHPGAGIYRLRADGHVSRIVLSPDENKLSFRTDLAQFKVNGYDLVGSPSTNEYADIMSLQRSRKLDINKINEVIDDVKNPWAAQAYAGDFLKGRPDFVTYHEKIRDRIKSSYPEADMLSYEAYIGQMNRQLAQRRQNERIKVGQPAPDIVMPGLDGKTRKLSDLKGKVVLVDFWASWCGPCRKANPHVVEVYNKYKSEGFDVFSVSLDGLDDRSIKRYRLSDADAKKRIVDSKNRWSMAIKQDGLAWDNHVSDLKKWDTASAREYGVTGIPKTFLIDREGKIAAINPRFNLEEVLEKTL